MEARYWHMQEDGRIQCDLCPRHCQLADGQRAFCFVRQRVGDTMELTTYGRSTGFCIDPIEKKPLSHFLPGTPVLSFGTAGCNLGCKFCQNWDISKSREVARLSESASPMAIADAAVNAGCRSVAFTYNDPVIFAEYAIDTARACRERGIRAVAVTAGYVDPRPREDLFAVLDAVNVDLKAFTDDFYRRLCFARLEPVLETLVYIKHETTTWLEVTTLVIPGHNDGDEELHRLCEWFAENLGLDTPLHFSAFHPDFKMTELGRTDPETLTRARAIAKSKGLHHVYTGNVHDLDGDTTRCGSCGHALIERDWYKILRFELEDGRCPACKAVLAGVFESQPGTWGRKRAPVQIRARP